jgi:hypothetical protein
MKPGRRCSSCVYSKPEVENKLCKRELCEMVKCLRFRHRIYLSTSVFNVPARSCYATFQNSSTAHEKALRHAHVECHRVAWQSILQNTLRSVFWKVLDIPPHRLEPVPCDLNVSAAFKKQRKGRSFRPAKGVRAPAMQLFQQQPP